MGLLPPRVQARRSYRHGARSESDGELREDVHASVEVEEGGECFDGELDEVDGWGKDES